MSEEKDNPIFPSKRRLSPKQLMSAEAWVQQVREELAAKERALLARLAEQATEGKNA